MKLAVIGTGYVGLVSGTCFADSGNDVTCVDIDEQKVAQLRDGQIPIYEPGLEPIFNRCRREERLSFTTDMDQAVREADIVFLCLPTPPGVQRPETQCPITHFTGRLQLYANVACNLDAFRHMADTLPPTSRRVRNAQRAAAPRAVPVCGCGFPGRPLFFCGRN